MKSNKPKIMIGTSGWSYEYWEGVFYPSAIKSAQRLDYYVKHFQTVEINNTFYQLPKKETFINWRKKVNSNFVFSVKVNRFITHIKKLKDCKEPLEYFFSRTKELGKNLGPILFQLPPKWKANPDRLSEFIKLLPKKYNHIFEFREQSWFRDEITSILKENNVGFCIHDMQGLFCPIKATSNIAYIRFHGIRGKYGGKYTKDMLKRWARVIKDFRKDGKKIYVYFNNDEGGYATENAKELREILKS